MRIPSLVPYALLTKSLFVVDHVYSEPLEVRPTKEAKTEYEGENLHKGKEDEDDMFHHGIPCRPDPEGDPSKPIFSTREGVKSITSKTRSSSSGECVNGQADGFPCSNINLLSLFSLGDMKESNAANDIWGWYDEVNEKEYALVGIYSGTAFVDVTDGSNPSLIGVLPSHTAGSSWRDIKVCQDHAYIVSEAYGHGLQVYDLTQLESVSGPDFDLQETAHMGTFGSAHNLFINENSTTAFIVGGSSYDITPGLYMVDISDPANPTHAGSYGADGYTHDVQCVNYDGPDERYTGDEICFACNEDTVTIVDVTDKSAPKTISKFSYDSKYTHQGWLTEDMRYFLMDDELDEYCTCNENTNTRVLDVSDLENPTLHLQHFGSSVDIDHNQYVHNGYAYQANYYAGLRILDLSSIDNQTLTEVAYFDIDGSISVNRFGGAWSVYPYLPSGKVIVSVIEQGLFILEPTSLAKTKNIFVHVRNLSAEYQRETTGEGKDKTDKEMMKVSITVNDHNGSPAEDAKVIGTFDNSRENIKTCVTNKSGHCSISHSYFHQSNDHINGVVSDDLMSFRVLGIEKEAHHYNSAENFSDENSEDGIHITMSRSLSKVVQKNEDSNVSKIVNRVKSRAGLIQKSMTPSIETAAKTEDSSSPRSH